MRRCEPGADRRGLLLLRLRALDVQVEQLQLGGTGRPRREQVETSSLTLTLRTLSKPSGRTPGRRRRAQLEPAWPSGTSTYIVPIHT